MNMWRLRYRDASAGLSGMIWGLPESAEDRWMDGPTRFPDQWAEGGLPLSLAGTGPLAHSPPAAMAPRRCPNGGESPHSGKES